MQCAQEGPVNTCSGGDVFQVIALRIADFFIRGIESILNKFIIASINQVIEWTGHKIDDICIEDEATKKYCPNQAELLDGWLGCDVNDASEVDHQKCYYLRQRAICMTDGDRYTRYKALFTEDSASELHEQFQKIAGQAYEDIPATMLAAFEGASAQAEAATSHSSGLPLQEEQVGKICDSTLTDALKLDEVILGFALTHRVFFEKLTTPEFVSDPRALQAVRTLIATKKRVDRGEITDTEAKHFAAGVALQQATHSSTNSTETHTHRLK